jgi:predicted transcriptional regulator
MAWSGSRAHRASGSAKARDPACEHCIEIATLLGISEETVQVHLKNIFAKLKVGERTAAVNVALRRGIVHTK